METIRLQGGKLHNLKHIDLELPKHQLNVITGVSGSGKSSLAFDILFEEGKNQYLSALGIFGGLENEERFDKLEGLGPTIAIEQSVVRQSNRRSTVGSKTKLLNRFAFIYASEGRKVGGIKKQLTPGDFLYTTVEGMCPYCQGRGSCDEIDVKALVPEERITLGELYEKLKITSGFLRVLKRHLGSYFEMPFAALPDEVREEVLYGTYENGKQSYCIERMLKSARDQGEDVEAVYHEVVCPCCKGERVSEKAREVTFYGKRIGELGKMTLTELLAFLGEVPREALSHGSLQLLMQMQEQLTKLIKFRLGHLSLYREFATLSGGERQRVFLHLHLESGLDSLIYVLDEPMAGLHPSEKEEVIDAVKKLRDMGNTVIVVEHDEAMIKEADHIIEIGPKAGREGGQVVFEGSYKAYLKAETLLSSYLTEKRTFPKRTPLSSKQEQAYLTITHANAHYLKDLTVHIPLHQLVGIAGYSGSGKSSLIDETLLSRLTYARKYGEAQGLMGMEKIRGFVKVSQEPIGRNSYSTPASYMGIWDKIRTLYAQEEKARERKMVAGDFSFHAKGACEACKGSGVERIFLTSDFSVDKSCPSCHGSRYREESLRITYKGKRIIDVLSMQVAEAITFFADQPQILRPLEVLAQMGMGYITLGQSTSSLSGGEAQRIKLAKELGKNHKDNMLYVLDEPTTGLSLYDTALLIQLLDRLVAKGHSVIVIEHNVAVLKRCDYLIELGPEGGEKGGQIIAEGAPSALINNPRSQTGRYLI